MRKLVVVLLAAAVVLLTGQPVMADPSGLNNRAFANATQPHPQQRDLAWAVVQLDRSSVTAQNTATAQSHDCQGCVAEAVAFQVDVLSDGTNLVLTNNATSANFNCETCTAVAIAEQWVVDDIGQPIKLTPAGQLSLLAVHFQLGALMLAPPAQLLAHLTMLVNEVNNILAQDVVVVPGTSPPAAVTAAAPLAAPAGGITITHYEQLSP